MSAHHVTIHAAGVDPAEITINDYHRTTGNDLVAVRIDHNEVVIQGTLAEMEAVVGRLAGLVAEATAARQAERCGKPDAGRPCDLPAGHDAAEAIPVRAVLCDDQARLETADGQAVAVITATIVAGQPIYAGDSLITQQLPVSGGWYWVGWPSASQVDRGPGVDLGDGYYLITIVEAGE